MERLDFEQPIVKLEEQLKKAIQLGEDNDADVTKIVSDIEKKLSKLRKETYGNLTAWQRVQISRHPNRPYTLDYIEMLTKGEFIELHGDRTVKDDKAMIGGFGNIDGQSVMFIGQQKGKNTKLRQYRNFGMANPEGYRKALRLMKMAEDDVEQQFTAARIKLMAEISDLTLTSTKKVLGSAVNADINKDLVDQLVGDV